MRGTITKLLTATTLSFILFSQRVPGQCALITDNYSGQVPSSVCAPVNLAMDVRYKFILPVDPSKVKILYVWNDGTGATTLVPASSQGDTVFTATATHIYPPADECSYTAEAYVVYDGQQCVSSSRQEQTFSAWARDNQNGADIITDPVVAQFCEGEDIVDVRFRDNSTFNCNINIEPDKPNRLTRWVQFIYGTKSIGGQRIPNVTIRDPLGNVYTMTDASGNSLPPVPGPIISIPIPADGPSQVSWPISAPAGAVAGDIFEITMRNWNICNPYDHNPFDAIPPSDLINGDNAPITTTALIEIITTPPVITNPSLKFCAGSPINLTLSTSGGTVNWYTDSLLTNHIHTGNSFNPAGAPTYIDNTRAGTYSFYVTETLGACASAPSKISFSIFDTPAPAADAGMDDVVCRDYYILKGNTPVIGTGMWSTAGAAVIEQPTDPHSRVHNLAAGPNLFRWTISNGPCVSSNDVIITRDLQPAAAMAGPDQVFCNTSSAVLQGNNVTNNGLGTWKVISGSASISDNHLPTATASLLAGGINSLSWTITSRYGACLTTADTMKILRDMTPSPANAGKDRGVCDSSQVALAALPVNNGGSGTWSVVAGTGIPGNTNDPQTEVSNLAFGINRLRWLVVSQFGVCPGSTDDVVITRDQAPAPALAGMDMDLCNSLTAPMGANAATIGTGTWSVVASPVATPPSFLPNVNTPHVTVQIAPGNEGVYGFAWTIVNASCRTSDTIRVDFGTPVPQAAAGPSDTVCGLSATLHANNVSKGTGTWTRIMGPGTVNLIPGDHQPAVQVMVNAGDEGLYTFEWRISSGSCPSTADTTTIFYRPTPVIPMAADQPRCGPGIVVLTASGSAPGEVVHWYAGSSGGSVLFTGPVFTTPLLNASTDYWISGYNTVAGCESARKKVHVAIHAIPAMPVAQPVQHCGNTILTLHAATGAGGNINRWYSASSGGSVLVQSTDYTTPLLSAPVTYWVSSFNDSTGCESNRASLAVRIDTIPAVPLVTDAGRCGEGTLVLQSAASSPAYVNRWYDAAVAGNLVNAGQSYTTPYLVNSTSYWTETLNPVTGCSSARVRINATIHPVPDFPNVNDISHCGPDSFSMISAPGANANTDRWYDSLTGGTMLYQGNTFRTPWLLNSKNYFVSSYNTATGCESSRLPAQAVILPVPGSNPVMGPTEVGIGQTNVIYSVNYHSGSLYNWTIPPGINILLRNQNFVIAEFPSLGTYNLSVTESNSIGCPGPPNPKQVTVKDVVILLDIHAGNGEVCQGDRLHLFVTPSGGTPSYTFTWSGDAQYLSANGISDPWFSAAVPGNYRLYVQVSDINGNHSSDTIHIVVHPDPVVHIQVQDTIVCAGNNLALHADVTNGSGIYSDYAWTGETQALSAVNIPDPLFSSNIKGTYPLVLTVTDSHGCMASDQLRVYNDMPQASFASNAVPVCSPASVNFTNQSQDATDYLWDFGDSTTSSLSNPVHTFINQSNSVRYFNVTLSAISANNCIQTSNGYVTVYPNPGLNISRYPEKACSPAAILLSSTPGGYSYNWNFGDGTVENGNFSRMHTFVNGTAKDSTFHITLISTSYFGCLDTGYTSIVVHPSPDASFTADPETQMMPDRMVTITNTTPAGNWTYVWKFGDESTSGERDPGKHEYPGPHNYTISLLVKGAYCADSVIKSIDIVPHPPVAEFKPIEPGCQPLTIQFQNTSTYSTSFLWEFGDGAVSNKPNPEYTYYEPGKYKIKLTAWGDGGSDTYSTVNDVWVLPKAYFDIAPRVVYVNDQAVHFFNLSDNGQRYEWDFGDGTGSTDLSPTHMYKDEGNYDVVLHVWTENQCYDMYSMETAVLVEPTGKIVFPNAFRPESPIAENRVFKPGVIDHVEEYHLMIFNRWGELIFESIDQEIGWDGYADGKMSKQDVYVWKVEGKYSNGQTFAETGDVTLMH